ncbi:MAG: FAD-binding oxidoreductase [Myxococcota bacterium]
MRQVRFQHGSTNATRPKETADYELIDTSCLNEVLSVDAERRVAIAEANVPMDVLLRETLKYNLVPKVVPEFPGITVGGAVQGAALESSSFRYGQFDATCLEYGVITADGRVLRCSKDENEDLYFGVVGSYGSLCLMTSVTIELIEAKPYVELEYIPIWSFREMVTGCRDLVGDSVDFVDGIMFSRDEGVLVVGRLASTAGSPRQTFCGRADPWFHNHARGLAKRASSYREAVPLVDYLFRYDRGAFWMGEYVFDILRLPRWDISRYVFDPLFKTRNLYRGLHLSNYFQEFFVQDIYFPVDSAESYLEYVARELEIYPIWVCPIAPGDPRSVLSPACLDTDLIINVGLWGRSHRFENPREKNREVETEARRLEGRKMLYSQQYYSESEFWGIYDRDQYDALRRKYGGMARFPDVHEKTVVRTACAPTPVRGFFKFYWSLLTQGL